MKTVELIGTTDALGALTIESTEQVSGWIENLVMDYDDGDTGADLVLTCENGTASQAIITRANLGTADLTLYPRALGNAVADAAAGTEPTNRIFCVGKLKAVIAAGGNAKNFRFIVTLSDY